MPGPDLSALTDVIDFTTVVAAVLALFASIVIVYVTLKAIQLLLAAVGRPLPHTPEWEANIIDEANERSMSGKPVMFHRLMARGAIRQQRFF